jgi:sulfate adenylyltransferase large subunit
MATGASTADLAVILIDGTKGLLPQTLRHTYISSLLGISSVVAAINKMDLLEYREDRFLRLEKEFRALAEQLDIREMQCIPLSALAGDNVVERSRKMPWYSGPVLLEYLETVPLVRPETRRGVRFPIQYVVRPDAHFRGFAGQVAGGVIRPGDLVAALPSGQQSRVESIVTYDGPLAEAFSPQSVTLKLEDEIDLSRGDMLVSPENPPRVSQRFRATVVWMHAQPLEAGRPFLIKQCARQVRGKVTKISYRVNVDTLETQSAGRLEMNDIAAVELETNSPIFFDSYQENRTTGSFIVIDFLTNATLGAGMIQEDLSESGDILKRQERLTQDALIAPWERHRRHGHYPAIFSVDARVALCKQLERALFDEGFEVMLVEENPSDLVTEPSWAALHAAGFVVIYHNPSLDPDGRLRLKAAAGDHFFDLAELDLLARDADAVEHVLTLAASLRIPPEPGNPWKVI